MTSPWFALPGILLMAHPGAQEETRLDEFQYKAKFLAFAAYYANFPPRAATPPIWVVGILGKSPFGRYIDEAFGPTTTIKGRRVQVVYPKTEKEVAACEVLFICKSEQGRLDEVLGWVKGLPVLTVGDTKGFANQGVMVNFFLEQSFVRTEVNLQAARKVGMDFHSAFLKNSRVVSAN